MAREHEVSRAASELRTVLGQLVRRLRSESALPLPQAVVLARLERDGQATASGLAAHERIRPQSIAETVHELEAAGLIDRIADKSDRRQILIGITEQGRTELTADRARRDGWLTNAIRANLSVEEQATLVNAVKLLQRLLERDSAETS